MKSMFKILLCFAVIFASLMTPACKGKVKQPQNFAAPVNAVKVMKTDLPFSMQYPAQIAGSLEIQVRAQVGGILKARLYNEGSYVEQGTQLFQIDDEPYKIAFEKAQGALAQVQSEEKRTRNDFNRMSILHDKNSISQKDYDDASAAYESAKANVQVAQAEVENARVNLGYTKVTAPISGMTGIGIPSIGSLIAPSGDSGLLTTMVQINPLYINFSMPANQFVTMAKGFVRGTVVTNKTNSSPIKVQVVLPDGTIYPEMAKIIFFDNSENPETSSILIRAALPNPKNQRLLLPGQFVRVNLLGVNYTNELVVPDTAVLSTASGDIAYVIKDDNTLAMRTVTGEIKNNIYMVKSGLKEGETVVLDGLIKVRTGEKVNPTITDFTIPVASANDKVENVNIPAVSTAPTSANREVVIKDLPVSGKIPIVSAVSQVSIDKKVSMEAASNAKKAAAAKAQAGDSEQRTNTQPEVAVSSPVAVSTQPASDVQPEVSSSSTTPASVQPAQSK